MVELTLIALLNRLMNWGKAPVIATRTVAADAPALHALLSDRACQSRLVAGVSPLLLPDVRPSPASNPRFLHCHVRLARRDVLWITWLLTPGRGTTELDLAAQADSDSIVMRLLMLAGRRPLRRRLERTLAAVATLARDGAEGLPGDVITTPPVMAPRAIRPRGQRATVTATATGTTTTATRRRGPARGAAPAKVRTRR